MKKIALSVAALALTAGSALAADLPTRKGPPMLPPPPPPPMWTGFYVGLNAGGGWSNTNSVNVGTVPLVADGTGFVPGVAALASGWGTTGGNGGFIGGGQVGYNWQFYNSFVVGVEADIQGVAGSSGGTQGLITGGFAGGGAVPVTSAVSINRSIDYFGTVRGRLGWLFTPTLLLYGTGGLAYGGITNNIGLFQAGTNGYVGFGGSNFSDTRVGWAAGGGVEWMFLPNWSAKVEYLYYDLGSVTQTFGVLGNGATAATNGLFAATQATTRFNGNVVRAGLNYHFNWASAPVVAKY